MSRTIQGEGFTIRESKFDYFFGRVASSPDNIRRSLQNLKELERLGIVEAAGGQARLMDIFAQGLNAPELENERQINSYGISICRQVEIVGPQEKGAIVVSYFYPGGNLSATPQVTSIIPKIYP